jgi:hypothetical protein
VELSNTPIDPSLPYWHDYLPLLRHLADQEFPNCNQLNSLLAEGLSSEDGHKICFVPSHLLDDEPYERRIYNSGRVSTRPGNWHDLFNAMVWMRFPAIKTAMNACHLHAWSEGTEGNRGQLRDALTLFDECGVIVFSSNMEILQVLAERCWNDAFLHDDFHAEAGLAICGHAMLEKYLSPYKSMTAKALLIHVDSDFLALPRPEILKHLDDEIARRLLAGEILTKPACLAPLPLAGVPGWWPCAEQSDTEFYADLQVFRRPPVNLLPAPVASF